jgi:hypothetical protein
LADANERRDWRIYCEYAQALIRIARQLYAGEPLALELDNTERALVFEMGQSNETAMYWASLLPDMGSDPQEWIKHFLLSCGFSEASKMGETDAYRSSQRRSVFVARP